MNKYKKCIQVLIILSINLIVSSSALSNEVEKLQGEALNFSMVLKSFLVSSSSLKKGEIEEKIAELSIQQANSAFYPSVDLASSSQRIKKFGTIPGIDSVLLGGRDSISAAETGLSLTYNIYNGGADVIKKHIAEESLTESGHRYDGARREVVLLALQQYNETKSKLYDLKIEKIKVNHAKKIFSIKEKEMALNKISTLQMSSSKLDYLEKENGLLDSQINYKHSLLLMYLYMKKSIEEGAYTASDEQALSDDIEFYPATLSEYGYASAAASSKIEAIKSKIRQSELEIKKSKTAYLPKISFVANYKYSTVEDQNIFKIVGDAEKDKWIYGINMTWNFFNGFSTSADVKTARQKLLKDKEDLDIGIEEEQKSITQIDLEINQYNNKLVVAQEKFDIFKEKADVTAKSLELGKSTPVDLDEDLMSIEIQAYEIKKIRSAINFLLAKKLLTTEV